MVLASDKIRHRLAPLDEDASTGSKHLIGAYLWRSVRPWNKGLTAHGGKGAVHGEHRQHLCPATAAAKPSRGRSSRAHEHLTRARGGGQNAWNLRPHTSYLLNELGITHPLHTKACRRRQTLCSSCRCSNRCREHRCLPNPRQRCPHQQRRRSRC